MKTGQTITRLRKAKGLTQRQLGELVGISQTSIAQIEKGHCDPTQNTLQAISRVFNTTPEVLLVCSIQLNTWPTKQKKEFQQRFPYFTEEIFKIILKGMGIKTTV